MSLSDENPVPCPQCGHAPLRTLHVTDCSFGDCEKGHTESECRECGWSSAHPEPVPCPGCGADLKRRSAIVQVATLDGLVVGQGTKQLQGDGSRYSASANLLWELDRITDRCAACGKELGHTDWPRF